MSRQMDGIDCRESMPIDEGAGTFNNLIGNMLETELHLQMSLEKAEEPVNCRFPDIACTLAATQSGSQLHLRQGEDCKLVRRLLRQMQHRLSPWLANV
jgi:hypothetical protein